MRLRRTAFLVVAFLALFPSRGLGQESALVRLAFSSGWDALPALVAIERGFFAAEGLVVSGLAIPSAVAVVNSLNAGSTDFAAVPQRVALLMVAAKVPVKIVAMAGWGAEMELVAKPGDGMNSLADLKGKRLAVLTGSEAFPVLVRLLNQARMRPADVKITRLPADKLTKALADNLADAVFETRHFTLPLVESGQARVIMTAKAVTDAIGLIGGMPLVVRDSVIEKQPKTVQKFVSAWVTGLRYIQQDPDDAARILQIFFHRQGVKVGTDMAKLWVRMVKYDQYVWSPGAIADAEYNGWGLNTGGIFKVAPKLEGFVDNRFAEKAAKATASP